MKHEELLMRILDDEVEPAHASEADAVQREPETRARLDQLRVIGALVRAVDAARPAPPDLTDSILSRVSGEGAVRAAPPRSGVRALVPRTRTRIAVVVAGGLALAAAAALVMRRADVAPSSDAGARASVAVPANTGPALLEDSSAESPVAIESVDFGAVQGAIFMVSSGPTDTLVVWTFDEADDKGRKIDL